MFFDKAPAIMIEYSSHSSGISCGSNVLANLNIAKQAVYLMET
jgi:hypothetical protein